MLQHQSPTSMVVLRLLALISVSTSFAFGLVPSDATTSRRSLLANGFAAMITVVATSSSISTANAQEEKEEVSTSFRRIPTQFIAALGDPASHEGTNAQEWGLWTVDPGPRGVLLQEAKSLVQSGVGPYGWKYDPQDWWLEEHGIVMESPDFPLPSGMYRVTGGRETTAILTIASNGEWSLNPYNNPESAAAAAAAPPQPNLYDVTHLPCRSARYTNPKAKKTTCSPLQANKGQFPVRPGGVMPNVSGCEKQDYAVLFVTAVANNDVGKSSEL